MKTLKFVAIFLAISGLVWPISLSWPANFQQSSPVRIYTPPQVHVNTPTVHPGHPSSSPNVTKSPANSSGKAIPPAGTNRGTIQGQKSNGLVDRSGYYRGFDKQHHTIVRSICDSNFYLQNRYTYNTWLSYYNNGIYRRVMFLPDTTWFYYEDGGNTLWGNADNMVLNEFEEPAQDQTTSVYNDPFPSHQGDH